MIEFERTRKSVRNLPLTAMIDVVFILIIFFMLTTSFMRYESMELLLPSAGGGKAANAKDVARIVINNDNSINFGQRRVSEQELNHTLETILTDNPNQRVVVFTDNKVSMQKLVSVMDMVTVAGGKSLYVRPLEKPSPLGALQ